MTRDQIEEAQGTLETMGLTDSAEPTRRWPREEGDHMTKGQHELGRVWTIRPTSETTHGASTRMTAASASKKERRSVRRRIASTGRPSGDYLPPVAGAS